jgi:nucleotide-binding universal stress UspA family protein
MLKILIAVDDTIAAKNAFTICAGMLSCMTPESITLCYVEKFEGKSMIDNMLGDAEMSTLKEALEGTDYQATLDKRASVILNYYKDLLEKKGLPNVRQLVKKGHPAEEILKAAREVKADMIVIGSRGKRSTHLFMGSVSNEVVNNADIPVLIVK